MSPATKADIVAAFHAAYIVFVVFGFAAIVIGAARGWPWVSNFYFRAAHLASILFVCLEVAFGETCPLTILENTLRLQAGQWGYPQGFIGYWIDRLIYYNWPPWAFALIYFTFAAMVIATLWLVPVRRPNNRPWYG